MKKEKLTVNNYNRKSYATGGPVDLPIGVIGPEVEIISNKISQEVSNRLKQIRKENPQQDWLHRSIPFAKASGRLASTMNEKETENYESFINDKLIEQYLPKSYGTTRNWGKVEELSNWYKNLDPYVAEVMSKSNRYAGILRHGERANTRNFYNKTLQSEGLTTPFTLPPKRGIIDNRELYNSGSAETFRMFPNADNDLEDYVNPFILVHNALGNLAMADSEFKQGNFKNAALNAGTGALALVPELGAAPVRKILGEASRIAPKILPKVTKAANNIYNKVATKPIKKALNTLSNIDNTINDKAGRGIALSTSVGGINLDRKTSGNRETTLENAAELLLKGRQVLLLDDLINNDTNSRAVSEEEKLLTYGAALPTINRVKRTVDSNNNEVFKSYKPLERVSRAYFGEGKYLNLADKEYKDIKNFNKTYAALDKSIEQAEKLGNTALKEELIKNKEKLVLDRDAAQVRFNDAIDEARKRADKHNTFLQNNQVRRANSVVGTRRRLLYNSRGVTVGSRDTWRRFAKNRGVNLINLVSDIQDIIKTGKFLSDEGILNFENTKK